MKTPPSAAALALATFYAQDPTGVERIFQALTPPSLQTLEERLNRVVLHHEYGDDKDHGHDNDPKFRSNDCLLLSNDRNRVIAQAVIRRKVHQSLKKYQSIVKPDVVEEALKYYRLPVHVQQQLANQYGSIPTSSTTTSTTTTISEPPTWFDSLQKLRELSGQDQVHLWRLILHHHMTAYVPVQCQTCGHVVPDELRSGKRDADVGLSEHAPKGDELDLRGGWFRGPREANILQLNCPKCNAVSEWYRSGHPKVILNPNRWGRLCGEQEDLRLALANYLGIQLRICLPIDWDHIWSEFRSQSSTTGSSKLPQSSKPTTTSLSGAVGAVEEVPWELHDDNDFNFAVRLDEGIGSWTYVWAIHPDPNLCADVTNVYLQVKQQGGRIDNQHAPNVNKYRSCVERVQGDASGQQTQAGTIYGYVVHRAEVTSNLDINQELKRAAKEYGVLPWWRVHEENHDKKDDEG